MAIAKNAAELGVELFVLDDGWFGKRDDDNSGLGDWFPNEKKLGCTLKELAERIVECEIQFGFWFEPECISEDSDLYRGHPDWAVTIPGRKPTLSRNQLILDFSREDVQDYLDDSLTQFAGAYRDTYRITRDTDFYAKWEKIKDNSGDNGDSGNSGNTGDGSGNADNGDNAQDDGNSGETLNTYTI